MGPLASSPSSAPTHARCPAKRMDSPWRIPSLSGSCRGLRSREAREAADDAWLAAHLRPALRHAWRPAAEGLGTPEHGAQVAHLQKSKPRRCTPDVFHVPHPNAMGAAQLVLINGA